MKIIISGGTGLVGTEIIQQLLQRGDEVTTLTTQKNKVSTTPGLTYSYWNPSTGDIDVTIFNEAHAIINLAGFNVANRWTSSNMKMMVDSRIDSTRLLISSANAHAHHLQSFVSTSASGYYLSSQEKQDESSTPGNGFLAQLTIDWEKAAQGLSLAQAQLCVLRVGVVLDKNDGALSKLLPFFKLGLGSPSGSGRQMMSWIHKYDLAKMYIHALDNKLSGAYNACSPKTVSNREFSKALALQLKRPYFLPPIPAFVLKMLFGEMSSMILNSQNLSAEKITSTGFKFRFPTVQDALSDLL